MRQGDVGYVSLWVPDAERAATFFSAVLGWSYLPYVPGQTRQVGAANSTTACMAATTGAPSSLSMSSTTWTMPSTGCAPRVAGPMRPPTEPYGLSPCASTSRGHPSPSTSRRRARGPAAGAQRQRQGDVSYITMEVRDSAAVRAFYGAVLGWHFAPGRVEDGWGPTTWCP